MKGKIFVEHSQKSLAAGLLVGAILLQGCKAAPPQESSITVVPVAVAAPANLENELTLSAEFRPFQEVDVMSKVAGYVRSINVDIGSRVSKGAILATLDVPEIQDDLAKSKAAVAAAEANVATGQAGVQHAQAAAHIAALSYQRLQEVATKDKGLIPRQELDVALAKRMETDAQLASANSSLKAAEQGKLGADSEYARSQAMLQYATIRAPFAGVVTKRYANTGSMIQAGISSQTQAMPLVRLAQNDVLRLSLPVPVSAVGSIRVGQIVDVDVSNTGRHLQGKIARYTDSVQTSTRTMEAEVDVSNADLSLVPGMYAEVKLHLADRPASLSVPLDAIDGLGMSTQQAYVVKAGTAHLVTVTVGLQTPNRIEILSGLERGDAVIVGRHTGIADGEKVTAHLAAYESNSQK